MTLLEMLNQTMEEMGFSPFTEYFGSNEQEARQLIALANREINQLAKDKWSALRGNTTINMTSDKLYPLPDNIREFYFDTAWSETRRVDFPTASDVWSYYVARNISTGLRHRMRITEGQFEILDPSPGSTIYLEYVANGPVMSNGGGLKPKFTADDDTLVINDDLFMLGVIYRFQKVKGLPEWQASYQEYRNMYRRERASDGSARTIQTADSDWSGPNPPTANLWL